MWSVLLGCSLPEVDSSPVDSEAYDPRSNPFPDDPTEGEGSTVDTGPAEKVAWSGDLLVAVSDPTHEYDACHGEVDLTVTGSDVTGYGNCLLTLNLVTDGSMLTLAFNGSVSEYGMHGRLYAQTDDDSFDTDWGATWPSDTEMRGDFSVVASEKAGRGYDGQFALTRQE
jgi:hypothetical protein